MNRPDAYYAGLFDGEGAIYLRKKHRSPTASRPVTVEIEMSCERTIDNLQHVFGWQSRPVKQRREDHKPRWRWRVEGQLALMFVSRVLPYLLTKREQVMEVLAGA